MPPIHRRARYRQRRTAGEPSPAFELLDRWEAHAAGVLAMTQSWPRALRHSLTQRIENSTLASMEALVNIRYRSEGRAQAIVELNRALKGQRFLWRLALRRGCIAHAQLGQVMTELDATGRMAQAWRKRILGGSDAP